MRESACILGLGTTVPATTLLAEDFVAHQKKALGLSAAQTRVLERITANSLIRKRHIAAPLLSDHGPSILLSRPKERNDIYREVAPDLAERACRKAMESWGGDSKDITHVISVSCTGFMAPGIELLMIGALGLPLNAARFGINFMGCFGALKGLEISRALANESPRNRVLLVCTELCSLHMQMDHAIPSFVSNALFADGAGAVVVGTQAREEERSLLALYRCSSNVIEETQDDMTWRPGNLGYEMHLGGKVASYLRDVVGSVCGKLVEGYAQMGEVAWAVHPGGKRILEAVAEACRLERSELAPSWEVLREYGNMSSATFLFVLQQILANPSGKEWLLGLGFGPGLGIEGLLMKRGEGLCGKMSEA